MSERKTGVIDYYYEVIPRPGESIDDIGGTDDVVTNPTGLRKLYLSGKNYLRTRIEERKQKTKERQVDLDGKV